MTLKTLDFKRLTDEMTSHGVLETDVEYKASKDTSITDPKQIQKQYPQKYHYVYNDTCSINV